jgi:hypothetical protein
MIQYYDAGPSPACTISRRRQIRQTSRPTISASQPLRERNRLSTRRRFLPFDLGQVLLRGWLVTAYQIDPHPGEGTPKRRAYMDNVVFGAGLLALAQVAMTFLVLIKIILAAPGRHDAIISRPVAVLLGIVVGTVVIPYFLVPGATTDALYWRLVNAR